MASCLPPAVPADCLRCGDPYSAHRSFDLACPDGEPARYVPQHAPSPHSCEVPGAHTYRTRDDGHDAGYDFEYDRCKAAGRHVELDRP